MTNEEFINELKKLNIILDQTQLIQLEKYYELLIEWNKKINLTRIIEKKEVYIKHFYDSITLIKAINSFGYMYILKILPILLNIFVISFSIGCTSLLLIFLLMFSSNIF